MPWGGSYRVTPTAATYASGLTFTVTAAAGITSGDLILLWITGYSTAITYSCPGFTSYAGSSGSNPVECQLLARVADGTEGATFVVTGTSAGSGVQVIQAVVVSSAIDVVGAATQASSANTAPAATGLTVSGSNEILLWFGAALNSGTFSGTAVTPPSGFTSRVTGSVASLVPDPVLADNTSVASGATGTQTGSSATAYWVTQMVAVLAVAPKTSGLLVMT